MTKETGLTVVDEIEENEDEEIGIDENGECEFSEIRQQVIALRNQSESSCWDLSEILFKVYNENLYRSWGFTSWQDYVINELDVSVDKARLLIKLQEWFGTMTPSIQEWMKSLGWTKARRLMHVVTVANAAEWRDRVLGKTVAQIEEMLQAERNALAGDDITEGASDAPDDKPVKWTASLHPGQKTVVEQAIQKAKEVGHTDKIGHALSLICIEYLGNNTTVLTRDDMLKNIEKNIGLKIIAIKEYDEEEDEIVYGGDYMDHMKNVQTE